jgi:hypothetical protein
LKIYLAARYSRFEEMQQYALALAAHGHTITSRWILGDHDIRAQGQSEADIYLPTWAHEDWDDLLDADACLSFTEAPSDAPGRSRGGRHVEHGIALALNKRCMVIGYRENIFHWLEPVEFYATFPECLAALTEVPHALD